ncbi:hypothetical protein F5890DRAFT_1550695 [Lentinula detonsa]|uniref:Uncharacterized protein n=1 Tax=Lentinula detonsa TaxID=2804962 RepID=A0AA38Q5X6_9AGAR|nr:hypothetical protein F5890DRAFT_1550695 [Lentinula detonsa]
MFSESYKETNLCGVIPDPTSPRQNVCTQLQPPPPMLLSTSHSAQLSPLPWKLLNLEMLSPPPAIRPPDRLSPLGELSNLKNLPPPSSAPFRPDSENFIFIDRALVSDERRDNNECFVRCQTMDKNIQNEYYTPQDPGLQNALQLSPEPDIVLPCWPASSTLSLCDCLETSFDNGSSPFGISHVCDDTPPRQIFNPIVAPSPEYCLQRWLRELEEMVDQLVEEDEY